MVETEKAFSRKSRHLRSLNAIRSEAMSAFSQPDKKLESPESLLVACKECREPVRPSELQRNLQVCPRCGSHGCLPARDRLAITFDNGRYRELDAGLVGDDPLQFEGYESKLKDLREKTGLSEAAVSAVGTIGGKRCVCVVLDSRFLMGSMGTAVGEKVARAVEYATDRKLPLVIFSASGGARMQEGIFSLMQMAKTSAAIMRHKDAGLLYISVMTHPTTGGVTASFASLGHIILAEPNALIGFAGPRVIKQTINQDLPEGFQRAESQLADGFVDAIVERKDMTRALSKIIGLFHERGASFKRALRAVREDLRVNMDFMLASDEISAFDHLNLARNPKRPHAAEYIDVLFDSFFELHGDRRAGDDKSIRGGLARFHGMPVMVIGQCKGDDVESNIESNFGMSQPEGYRKVQRLASIAELLNMPVVTFIDTPGAYPGIEAERHGQGEAIAACLAQFSHLRVPVISFVIGEGGSGGALALGVADSVIMLENAVYSVLSPEGFASILWKDSSRAAEAADVMKITAADLLEFGIVDRVIKEGEGGASENSADVFRRVEEALTSELLRLSDLSKKKLLDARYERYRKFGSYRYLEQ